MKLYLKLYPFVLFFCFLNPPIIAQTDLIKSSYRQLDSIGNKHKSRGEYDKVILYMQAGREKARAEVGVQDTLYAYYVCELGLFYTATGQYKLAEESLLESKNIYLKKLGKWHKNYAKNLTFLAQLYLTTKDLDKAEVLLLESKEIVEKVLGKENHEYATLLNNLAMLYKDMGNLTQAELLHIETRIIRAKVLGKEHPHYAMTLNNLGYIYKMLGRFAEAEPLYLEANEIRAKVLGKQHHQYAQGLNNLALLYAEMGKEKETEALLLECKEMQEKSWGKEHPTYSLALNNLGGLYQKMKLYTKAEQLYLEARAIREKTQGKRHPDYANIINALAGLYIDMGKNDLAWDYLRQNLQSTSGIEISVNITEAWKDSLLNAHYPSFHYLDKTIRALRTIYLFLGSDTLNPQKEKQAIVAELANQLLEKTKNTINNEQDKLRILSQSYHWMLNGLKVMDLDNQMEKAFELVEMNKASLLLDITKNEQNYQLGGLPDSLIEEEKALLKEQAKLEAGLLENSKNQPQLLSQLNSVGHKIANFKRKVEEKFPKYAAIKYKQTKISIKNIQDDLAPNTALMEYVLGDSIVYIFYVDKKQSQIFQQVIGSKELSNRIEQLHTVLGNYELLNRKEDMSYRLYTEQAYWFYQNLIAPVLANKKSIQQLIIVPDGELGHLPFETFLVEQAPQTIGNYKELHYLIKDYKISYNYSATLWKVYKNSKETIKGKNNGQIFGMASNYHIKLDSSKAHWRLPHHQRLRQGLKPLPAAKKEVETLAQEFSGFFGFDNQASEKKFKEKAGDYAIIHLAMHGLLDKNAPILSGLAFTEDGDSLENNFLQAYEISKMELNADLVVLSACETGFGKFDKGNGIASLAQAFAYAGASALIVSLWQVNDFATSEIMKNLYQNLAKGMDKDEALRQAKLQYMQKATGITAHPAFWSPFIMMGNTDAVYIKTKGDWTWWLVGGGILLFAGVAVFKLRNSKLADNG